MPARMRTTLLACGACLCLIGSVASPLAFAQDGLDSLRAQSAALTQPQRAQAQDLFATSFTLWQSGDFAAAEIGFKAGLAIDPANAPANFYYGDCLVRRKDKVNGRLYLTRAATLGGTSLEALKAQAELQTLAIPTTNVGDMSVDEVKAAFVGSWTLTISGAKGGSLTIVQNSAGKLTATGKIPSARRLISEGTVTGDRIELLSPVFLLPTGVLHGKLLSPTRMEGTYENFGSGSWSADKQ